MTVLLGDEEEGWEDLKDTIQPCADFMIEKINKQKATIMAPNCSNRSIRIA